MIAVFVHVVRMERANETAVPNPNGGRSAVLTSLLLVKRFRRQVAWCQIGGITGAVLRPTGRKRRRQEPQRA
jgi:hypothetical protein